MSHEAFEKLNAAISTRTFPLRVQVFSFKEVAAALAGLKKGTSSERSSCTSTYRLARARCPRPAQAGESSGGPSHSVAPYGQGVLAQLLTSRKSFVETILVSAEVYTAEVAGPIRVQ